METLGIRIPITKIDEEKRLVYGTATEEAPDRTNEIFDYDSSVPYYRKWSENIEKTTNGKSKGNVRAMHSKVAAGVVKAINFDDEAKKVNIVAHITDDQEWRKVLSGTYSGFSHGGSYVKRWADPNDPEMTRYTADISEISLVDLPCLPSATFDVIKANGVVEVHHFTTVKKADGDFDPDEVTGDDLDEALTQVSQHLATAAGDKAENCADYLPEAFDRILSVIVSSTNKKYVASEARDTQGKWTAGAAGAVVGAAAGGLVGGVAGAIAGGANGAVIGAQAPRSEGYNYLVRAAIGGATIGTVAGFGAEIFKSATRGAARGAAAGPNIKSHWKLDPDMDLNAYMRKMTDHPEYAKMNPNQQTHAKSVLIATYHKMKAMGKTMVAKAIKVGVDGRKKIADVLAAEFMKQVKEKYPKSSDKDLATVQAAVDDAKADFIAGKKPEKALNPDGLEKEFDESKHPRSSNGEFGEGDNEKDSSDDEKGEGGPGAIHVVSNFLGNASIIGGLVGGVLAGSLAIATLGPAAAPLALSIGARYAINGLISGMFWKAIAHISKTAPEGDLSKVTSGETKMPTNEQITTRAQELAKAAGGNWIDFIEKARADLAKATFATDGDNTNQGAGTVDGNNEGDGAAPWTVNSKRPDGKDELPTSHRTQEEAKAEVDKRKAAGHTDCSYTNMGKTVTAEELEKAAVMVDPAEVVNGVEQVWTAPDGKTFKKKADAVAWAVDIETKARLAKVTAPVTEIMAKIDATMEKRDFSQEQRDDAADAGQALPDGSFPIKNVEDLKNAVKAFGRAKDPAATKAHIKKRAKALGAESELPEGWAEKVTTSGGLQKDATMVTGSDHGQLSAVHREMAEKFRDKAKGIASSEGNAKLAATHREHAHIHDVAADLHDRAIKMHEVEHPDADKATNDAFAATEAANMRTGTFLKAIEEEDLAKGLPTVAEFAYLIQRLTVIKRAVFMEAKAENDGSTLPDKLKKNIDDLLETFTAMATEEAKELTEGQNVDELGPANASFCMMAGLPKDRQQAVVKFFGSHADANLQKFAPELEKAGARNSAADIAKIQVAHDALVELGALCGGAKDGEHLESGSIQGGAGAVKVHQHTHNELHKVIEERDALIKSITDLHPKIEKMAAEIETLRKSPVPRPTPNLRIIEKGDDGQRGDTSGQGRDLSPEDLEKVLASMSTDERARLMMKVSQSQPLAYRTM